MKAAILSSPAKETATLLLAFSKKALYTLLKKRHSKRELKKDGLLGVGPLIRLARYALYLMKGLFT